MPSAYTMKILRGLVLTLVCQLQVYISASYRLSDPIPLTSDLSPSDRSSKRFDPSSYGLQSDLELERLLSADDPNFRDYFSGLDPTERPSPSSNRPLTSKYRTLLRLFPALLEKVASSRRSRDPVENTSDPKSKRHQGWYTTYGKRHGASRKNTPVDDFVQQKRHQAWYTSYGKRDRLAQEEEEDGSSQKSSHSNTNLGLSRAEELLAIADSILKQTKNMETASSSMRPDSTENFFDDSQELDQSPFEDRSQESFGEFSDLDLESRDQSQAGSRDWNSNPLAPHTVSGLQKRQQGWHIQYGKRGFSYA